jgi:two-component system, cell cycle sensor histidine kinase and response regulator CckA
MAWQLMDEIAARIEGRVLMFLDRAHIVNEINTNTIKSGQIDLNSIRGQELHFWHQVKSFDYTSYSYIGRADGGFFGARRLADGTLQTITTKTLTGGEIRFFNTDPQGRLAALSSTLPYYDHKTRPWYKAGMEAGKPTWSPVFIDAGGEGLTITAATPLYDRPGKLIGVLGCSFIFSHINQFLRSLKIGETGQAFIVERSGLLVATSTLDETYTADKKRIATFESKNPVINQAGKSISLQVGDFGKIDRRQRLSISLQGERHFVHLSPLTDRRGIEWLTVVIIPEKDFMSSIKSGNFNTVLLSLLALGITITVGLMISRRITRPILELNIAAKSLADGQWSQELQIDRQDEVGELAGSFNLMVRNLRATTVSRDRLVEEVEERKKIEEELQKLAAVVEHSSELINLADLDGKMIFLNEAGGIMLGIPPGDVESHSIMEIFPDELKSKFENEVLPAMLREGRWKGDLQYRNLLTGHLIDVHAMTFTIRNVDGEPLYLANVSLDITERKQADEALRESEEKFSTIFRLSPACISLSTLADGRYVAANDLWFKTAEYSPKEAIGHTSIELGIWVNPEDRERLAQTIMEGGVVRDHEYLLRSKSGKIYSILFSAEIIEINGVPHIVSIASDITERIKAEVARRESEQRLSAFIDFLPDATLAIDENKRIIIWNRAIEEMTGIPAEEMIGKGDYAYTIPFYGVARPQLMDLFWESNSEIASKYPLLKREGENFVIEVFCPALYNGKGAFVWAKAAPLHDSEGRLIGAIECIRDITERKQAEEELQESQRRLSDIIEFMPDATLVIDKDGKVIAWNRMIEAMTGVKKEDMLGKGNYEYAIPFYRDRRPILIDLALHPDTELEKQYTAVQRVGEILFGESFTPNLPPGDIHLSATASILRDSRGEIIAAIECIRDNTERKRLEERLNRAEKMEGLGRLAGGVAHDLNNVLGVLVGYSELLAEKLPDGSPLKRYAENIQQSSLRGAAIIQDLLTLARRGVTVSEVVDLNKVIFDYLKTPEFETLKSYHPNVKVRTELEEGLLNMKGSPVHLSKTVMNLVSNAAEAISGPGEVTIRTENSYLDRPVRGYDDIAEGDYVVLTVSDNGKGIPAQDIGKIFEPFYTKKVMGRSGTGLGLAVVWGTAKDHHGYIDVQSEEGEGTMLTLYFPVTRDEPTKAKETVSPSVYMGRGESILVVDDVKEQRELALSMLGRLGYQVAALSSGEEAIGYLKNKKVDLVVLDMIMEPGIDGLETYRRMLEINPEQKAIIVSGFSETDRVRKAQESGAGAFVRKPYVLEKIGLAVRKELDRK